MSTDRTDFKQLSAAVDGGHLRLESEAANRCVEACDAYIAGLKDFLPQTRNMVRREAFGTLTSGQQLAQKFVNLSNGSPGSLQDVLNQHIAVASDMRDVFFKAGAAYRAIEEDNQSRISAAGAEA